MIGGMRKEYASLRRRPFLTPVWLLALAGMLALGVAAWAVLAASTTIVVVMRHAEKAADGTQDPPLSAAGVERAGRIAAMFGGGPRELAVDTIFVTQWRRTGATATPLATRLGVPMISVQAEDLKALEARILHEYRGRRVLVVAHSDTVPELVHDLARGATIPLTGDGEYGTAYVIAIPRWSRPAVLRVALP
jgi:broad specificity phosphatase PhoE